MSHIISRGRRHFLAGAGGCLVGVPFLESLARAQTAGLRQKRFVVFGTDHGGIHFENMYPDLTGNMQVREVHPAIAEAPAHSVRARPLAMNRVDGRAHLSPVLSGDPGVLTPRLAEKLNVLVGLDVTTYIGHHRAGFNGNFAANDQNPGLHGMNVPTLDQLVASSPGFNQASVAQRSINFALGYGQSSSVRFAASAERIGDEVVTVQATNRPSNLWDRLFPQAGPEPSARVPVLDRIVEHYRALTRGAFGDARRLSAADRSRLEAHLSLLEDIQRSAAVQVECEAVAEPTNGDDLQRLRAAADLTVAALQCGASHVAVITCAGSHISREGGWTNWHEQVAHNGGGDRTREDYNPEFQRIGWMAQRTFFEEAFLRVAAGLDAPEDESGTFLDRSFLYWAMESGDETHAMFDLPVITAGSADGFFETGRLIDFRNRDNTSLSEPRSPDRRPGLLYNQFLASVLQGMGVSPEVYRAEMLRVQPEAFGNDTRGYGLREYHPSSFWRRVDLPTQVWPTRLYATADQPLPFLVAGA